jgi:8-oxo-dGTP pyrophosphatase MutT (NUDIX family)
MGDSDPIDGAVEAVTDEAVRAAGCVVWRRQGDQVEVLLVHRPRRRDWTFPKGKVEPIDSDDEHTALREVLEETSYRGALGRELPSISYRDHHERAKTVRYWDMEVQDGTFVPNAEVDEVAWLSVLDAAARLTYGHDRDVLAAFAEQVGAA